MMTERMREKQGVRDEMRENEENYVKSFGRRTGVVSKYSFESAAARSFPRRLGSFS